MSLFILMAFKMLSYTVYVIKLRREFIILGKEDIMIGIDTFICTSFAVNCRWAEILPPEQLSKNRYYQTYKNTVFKVQFAGLQLF